MNIGVSFKLDLIKYTTNVLNIFSKIIYLESEEKI